MAFNVTELQKALPAAGQRPNLFNMQFEGQSVDNSGMSVIDFDLLTFRACSVKYDGVRKLTFQVIEDEDFSSLALLREFKKATWTGIEVHTYAKNGAVTSTHKFDVVPSTMTWGTELSWDDNDSMMTWQVSIDVIKASHE